LKRSALRAWLRLSRWRGGWAWRKATQ
jgi:hypothetical protein